jgi:hypothetical protein
MRPLDTVYARRSKYRTQERTDQWDRRAQTTEFSGVR